MKQLMITLTGPSCGGKTHLLNRLVSQAPETFEAVKSLTTRSRRAGEGDGEYEFVDQDEFDRLHAMGFLCQSVQFEGVSYGTDMREMRRIFESGKTPIRIVEPSGVGQFERVCKPFGAEVFAVYVDEDEEILIARWLDRFYQSVASGEIVDMAHFTRRILKTVKEEYKWLSKSDRYDYVVSPEYKTLEAVVYELGRIGAGKVPLRNARLLSPKSNRAAA